MKRLFVIAGTCLLAAACGDDAPREAAKPVPATLPPGQYEVTATVTSLASTDKSPLPTFAKEGDRIVSQGCVGADGLPQPELLAAKGDVCQLQNPYVRAGRMNFQLDCSRQGQGKIMVDVTGNYTADGFTGSLTANSFFAGAGDYRLVEELSARKIADQCSAPPAVGPAPQG